MGLSCSILYPHPDQSNTQLNPANRDQPNRMSPVWAYSTPGDAHSSAVADILSAARLLQHIAIPQPYPQASGLVAAHRTKAIHTMLLPVSAKNNRLLQRLVPMYNSHQRVSTSGNPCFASATLQDHTPTTALAMLSLMRLQKKSTTVTHPLLASLDSVSFRRTWRSRKSTIHLECIHNRKNRMNATLNSRFTVV